MSTSPVTVIACDIGGVLRNQQNDEPIENALDSIRKLSENKSIRIILISKCKERYAEKSNTWLKTNNLSHIETYFCLEYEEKVKIATDNKVNVMIDDRMQVLRNFPSSIIKIWFCSDRTKIDGAKRFQPDFVDSVRIAQNWEQIVQIVEEIQT
ncbi:unnamed protein product [Didymodactylos carnosus]|uniref:Uncharacterized protein n=1 Tax=Didymodactylos carnosus TaxID=1234261 RepID=A0A814DEI2_9BILA|nr:unnamed protein product [Didymodactylos carnosus]CAF1461155.1 unnamed protein product [Didymodactylos carnosus]CAF3728151.1 unnamed protein product [Didymodactylos carnosus]CAF4254520.1 unnamed protein product [Didymodactylos carnosus]